MVKLIALVVLFYVGAEAHADRYKCSKLIQYDSMPLVLPGTKLLTWDLSPLDMSRQMLEGAHQLIDQKIQEAMLSRDEAWSRDFRSREAYEKSVEPNLGRFMDAISLKNQPEASKNYGVRISGGRGKSTMKNCGAVMRLCLMCMPTLLLQASSCCRKI